MSGIRFDTIKPLTRADMLKRGQVIRFSETGDFRTVTDVEPVLTSALDLEVKLTTRVHGWVTPIAVTVPAAEEFRVHGIELESVEAREPAEASRDREPV